MLNADVVISEVVASNSTGRLDYHDSNSDWLEILNRGPSRVDLKRWHLSNDLQNLTQWEFPISTVLASDERLVVVASGRDDVASNGELHTNFKLGAGGEPLVLTDPEGTFVHGFDPAFPAQARDVSYGLAEVFQVTRLVAAGSLASALVPTDGSLAASWTGGDELFDEANWISGTTGVGYDTSQIGGPLSPPVAYWTFDELIHGGTTAPDEIGQYDGTVSGATLTTEGQGRYGKALSLDGHNDYVSPGVVPELVAPSAFSISLWFQRSVDHAGSDNETNHAVNNVLIAQSYGGSNDNLEIGTEADAVEVYLDTAELGGSVAPVRQSASLQNDTWHHLVVSYDSDDANELKLHVDGVLVSEHNEFGGLVSSSGTSPFTIGLARPGQNEWGDFEGLIDDVAIWDIALDSDHASALFGGMSPLSLSGYNHLLGLDLAGELAAAEDSTSAYVRVPFTVDDPASFDLLTLRMRYDDAFVAYLNGAEVARANVTAPPQWNSAADTDRPNGQAFRPEEFVIPNTPRLLNLGPNILAVQALKSTADATRLMIVPELDAVPLPDKVFSFMVEPTPGAENTEGLSSLMDPPTYSAAGGTYTDDFLLELAIDRPDGQIRYTTDRNLPSEGSTLYTEPILISGTTQIRARVFGPGSVASNVVSETYVKVDEEVQSFSSNLPIVVMDNFGRGNPGRGFQNAFLSIFEPDLTGRSRLTNPANLTSRMGLQVHGNSSANLPKPGYRIETRDEANRDEALELLSMPAESDWIFKGPYTEDQTLIQNALTYDLSRKIGHYSSRTRFVELFGRFSGSGSLAERDYRGVYVLTERVKADPNRVDIERLSSQHNSEPELTGGYMLKIDPPDVDFNSSHGNSFVLVEPDPSTLEQQNYIRNYVNQFEAALYGPNFTDPEIGYRSYIDVDGFINECIIRSLARAGWVQSIYLFKDRGGKLSFGPLWDFNSAYRSGTMGIGELHVWYARLFEDVDFAQQFVDRWHELRETVFTEANILATIDGMTTELAEAQVRNFERWPEAAPLPDWEGNLPRLKNFVLARLPGMDGEMLSLVSFNQPGGEVPVGFEAELSVGEGTIYYTLDGSDPREPGGGISPQAIEYTGQAIMIDGTTRIFARTSSEGVNTGRFLNLKQWSAPTIGDFVVPNGLVVSEVQYNPHDALTGQGELDMDNDEFEYIELSNTGIAPIDLGGLQFVQVDVGGKPQGVDFTFVTQTLAPGEQIVVVKNRVAFQSRYGTGPQIAGGDDAMGGNDGEYGDQLANRGERVSLLSPSGVTLFSFDYEDGNLWPERADRGGSSLELIDPSLAPDEPSNWRGSVEHGGSPGAPGMGVVSGVIVNEVLTNTPSGVDDAIEFFNSTAAPIDLGGMWLSDNLDNLDRYVIPGNTVVPAGGYLVLDENDFNFGLSGGQGEDVLLVQPDGFGNPDLFIDHVTFGPALEGESFGRWPDESGSLFPMISTTLGSANSGPRVGPVVISEIMYDPAESDMLLDSELLEFIEIYNPTVRAVDLTGWTLDRVGYQFDAPATIGPGQTLTLVPFNPAAATSHPVVAFESTYEVEIAASLSSYHGPYPKRLDNGGDTLTLRRPLDPPTGDVATLPSVIEDQVSYEDLAPWPTGVDGTGDSIQRLRVDLWGKDPVNWTTGTPTVDQVGVKRSIRPTTTTTVIGEAGKVTNLTHEPQTITLNQSYANPIVFAQPASFNEEDPALVRVTNVRSNQFTLFLVEPSNLDGVHHIEETVGYVVLEEGSHWWPDGTHLEVGSVTTNATVSATLSPRTWETVQFTSSFAAKPVVLSQVQTAGGEMFLSTRQRMATTDDFQVALEPEEKNASQQGVETVGYLAIDVTSGSWSGMPFEAFEAETANDYFAQFFQRLKFDQKYDFVPSVLTSLSTYNGADNSHLRFRNLDLDSIDVKVEEDTSADNETLHAAQETVSYLVIGGEDPLTAATASIPDGLTRSFTADVGETGRLHDVDVRLELVHTNIEDLDIFLEAPDGSTVELLTDISADGGRFSATTLDDKAEQSITSGTTPYAGRFQPEGRLLDFAGKDINGTWTLHVTDDTVDTFRGALLRWSLDILVASEPPGNLNQDENADATDIDVVFANLGSANLEFDLDEDRDVDLRDVDRLVLNIMGKRYGDVDLDQDVDIADVNTTISNYDPLDQHPFPSWAQGNFDGDNDVDISDTMWLAMNYAPLDYNPPDVAVSAVIPVDISRTTAVVRTTTNLQHGINEESVPLNSSAERGVGGSALAQHDYVIADHYFRSERRRHSGLAENEK